MKRKPKFIAHRPTATKGSQQAGLRIIGGRFGGRKLAYNGQRRTRPMKDRIREAVFNLIGPSIRGMHAIDLFAGTGALGLEALSRGAARATLIERHFPTARIIHQNIATIEVEDITEVVTADTFIWVRRLAEAPNNRLAPAPTPGVNVAAREDEQTELFARPWAVFCSPPYDFYVQRTGQMLQLVGTLLELAPPESVMVVEADQRLDCGLLPDESSWDVRTYPPAVVALKRLSAPASSG